MQAYACLTLCFISAGVSPDLASVVKSPRILLVCKKYALKSPLTSRFNLTMCTGLTSMCVSSTNSHPNAFAITCAPAQIPKIGLLSLEIQEKTAQEHKLSQKRS